MIEIRHLTKRYGRLSAVEDLSTVLEPGRITCLLGHNGAGKSTTLRALLGLTTPTSGQALIDGRAYRDLEAPTRVVGHVLDACGAHRSRTARAHLTWIAQAGGVPRARVAEVLGEVGLAGAAGRRVGTFSLGMRRRLALAAALLGDPPVLVLDEPEGGLDPAGIVWLRRLLRERADGGATVLLSSHAMTEVARIADRVLVLSSGRLVADGTVQELSRGHADLEEAYFALVDPPGTAAHPAADGVCAPTVVPADVEPPTGSFSAPARTAEVVPPSPVPGPRGEP